MNAMLFFWLFFISIPICVSGDTDYFLELLDICRRSFHSCESGTKNVYCSCDRMCVYYDNCCFDAAAIKEGGKELIEDDQHRQYLQMTTCEIINFGKDELIRQGAFMISSCPVSWDSDVDTRQACELDTDTDVRDMLPVFESNTKLTFKNRHCAKCHSVQNYIPWLLVIKCLPDILPPSLSLIEDVMTKLQSDCCSYSFIPPDDVTVHYCYQEFDYAIISNSSEGNKSSTCRNRVFSPLVVLKGRNTYRYHRNLQCLIATEGSKYTDVLNTTYCTFPALEFGGKSSPTLSSLIDFSSVLRRRVTKCKDDEIQLSDKIGCRRLYCPAHSEPAGGECVDINYVSDGCLLDLLFEVNNVVDTSDIFVSESFSRIIDAILVNLGNHTRSKPHYNLASALGVGIVPSIQRNSGQSCSVIQTPINVKGIKLTDDTLESERSWIANFLNNYTVRNPDGSVMRHIADVRDMLCKTNGSVRNPLYLQEMLSVDNDLPCPAVKLQYSGNESDTESETNNVSLSYFHLHGIRISQLDAVFANGDHFVCIDTFSSKYQVIYRHYDTMKSYRSYINTACASISITCMIYCLIQYCVIPIFRDGKSDMVIVLILFLLLAQTCFFIFSHFEIQNHVCEWVGIIHHFTWLCAFVFMFLCPYRLNAEIRDLQTYSRSERKMATGKYMIVGISLPLFVIICIKTANLHLAPTEKWYGGRLCFISQTFVLLFGFVVPVAFILCGNAILLICIIHYMTTTSIAANSSRSNVMVFVKISTVMGFSWIIGIVAILSQSDVLLLVFEVLSNLQGTFISITFSCSSRVKSFYKGCFQQVKCSSSAKHATS